MTCHCGAPAGWWDGSRYLCSHHASELAPYVVLTPAEVMCWRVHDWWHRSTA